MITLFENEDFILESTGNDYDFVGVITIKSDKSMTFYFEEELAPVDETDEDAEWEVDENQTKLADVVYGLDEDEAERQIELYQDVTSCFTQNKEDGWLGFLSDCQQRGWFLALIKTYCPEQLTKISWA